MILGYADYKDFLFGVEKLNEKNGRTYVYRYSKDVGWTAPRASAGVTFDFVSNTEFLHLKLHTLPTNVNYCYVDVYADGVLVGHNGYCESNPPVEGDVELSVTFKPGDKRIQVYFPTFYECAIDHFELSDDAKYSPSNTDYNIVFYGDSITQGYTCPYPGNTYPNIVCRNLNAKCLNQAAGGSIFTEKLIVETSVKADLVCIAYGFNDWTQGRNVEKGAAWAIEEVKKVHPTAKIVVITPVFCGYIIADGKSQRAFFGMPDDRGKNVSYDFYQLHKIIENVCANYQDVTVIDGLMMIPPETKYLQHDLVHPTEAGFVEYGKNLTKQLKAILKA